jgi:hypothetical protein
MLLINLILEYIFQFDYVICAVFHHQLPEALQDALLLVQVKPELEDKVNAAHVHKLLENWYDNAM